MMSIVEFLSQPLWQRLGLTLVHFLWQGLAVAVLVGAFVGMFRLNHGNARYAVYLLAFIAMIVCPVATFTTIDIPISPGAELVREAEFPQVVDNVSYAVLPAGDILPEAATSSPAMPTLVDSIPLGQRISDWLNVSMPWVLVIWMVGVIVLSGRLVMGFVGVYRWRHHLQPLPEGLGQRVASLSETLGMRGFSRVFISPTVLQAMAVGYLRPMVLLPAAMVAQMQPEMLEAVIAHELAHIRRLDLWINLAQRVTETLLFYHPAVWWLSSCIRSERELCCDELAVKATGRRLTYATTLESVGRAKSTAKQPVLAAGLGQDSKPTLSRVRHILGLTPTRRNCPFWLAGVIAVVFLAALVIPTTLALTSRASEKNDVQVEAEDDKISFLEGIYGKPAPELQQIKGWKNSRPITLADQRGKFVLLDFWGYWCGPCLRDIPHLMAIYEAFSDRGLMVIGIHDDSVESINEMDAKLTKAREMIWKGRNLNFPIALDGGGETKINGTDLTVRGATTAAYGITAFPTAILIDRDGKVIGKFHAPSLDEKLEKLEKLLGVQAKTPEWKVRFNEVYRLDDGELLRHIPGPYIPERNDFYFRQFARWGWFYTLSMKNMPRIPESSVLTWDEKKNQATGGMDYGYKRLIDLLRDFGFDEKEFEGNPAVLEQRIPGDWIKRDTARREDLLKAFENILNSKLNLSISFVPHEAERDVFVARGAFKFHPIKGEYRNNEIQLFAEKPDPPNNIQGGGGSGSLDSFLAYVGRLRKTWVINETETDTVGKLVWRQHSSTRGLGSQKDHALFEKLLKNINKQTSLRFYKDRRKRKIWLVNDSDGLIRAKSARADAKVVNEGESNKSVLPAYRKDLGQEVEGENKLDVEVEKSNLKELGPKEGDFQLDTNIPVHLELGKVRDYVLVTAKHIRFERKGAELHAVLTLDEHKGGMLAWNTILTLLDAKGKRLAQEYNRTNTERHRDPPALQEGTLSRPLVFAWDAVSKAERFRIEFEQLEPIRDPLGRVMDAFDRYIEGAITDSQGKPIQDAFVTICEEKERERGSWRVPQVITDGQGHYQLGEVPWPYKVSASRLMPSQSDGIRRTHSINWPEVHHKADRIDMQFDPFPEGQSTLIVKAKNQFGQPFTNYHIVFFDYVDYENPPEGRYLTKDYRKDVTDPAGSITFSKLPAGDYKIWLIPKDRQYQTPDVRITIGENQRHEETIIILSKLKLYGRILFEDGSPPVIHTPEGRVAKAKITYARKQGRMASGIGEVDENGYFEIHLKEDEYEALQNDHAALHIHFRDLEEEGSSKSLGVFPVEKLSKSRESAGTFIAENPDVQVEGGKSLEDRGEEFRKQASEDLHEEMKKKNAREFAEAYVTALKNKDWNLAASMCRPGSKQARNAHLLGEMCHFNDTDIETLYANKKIALAVTEGLRQFDGRKWQLAFTLTKQEEGWIVKDIDWLPLGKETQEIENFRRAFPDAQIMSKGKPAVQVEISKAQLIKPEIIETSDGRAKVMYLASHVYCRDIAKLVVEKIGFVADKDITCDESKNRISMLCRSTSDAERVAEFLQEVDVEPIQVQIDVRVVEAYPDVELDWETRVAAKNITRAKTTSNAKPEKSLSAADILRETAKTEPQPENTVEKLIDLLASRGYLKIVMNPTLKVQDGKTAKIRTSSKGPGGNEIVDSFEITPRILDDGNIDVATKLIFQNKQMGDPRIHINIKDSVSLVIGSVTKTEKRAISRNGVKDSEERTTEVLVILTPTIITPEMNSSEKVAMQIEGGNRIEILDIETLLTKVRKALQPTDNMRVSWQSETVEPFEVGVTKSSHTVREYVATMSGFKSRLEYLQKTYTSKASKDPYDIRGETYVFDGKQCRHLEERIKGGKTTNIGWEKSQNVTAVLLFQELFAFVLPLHNEDKLKEYEFTLADSPSPGIYVVKIIRPEDGSPNQMTIDGSRGFNVINTQWFGPKNRKTLEDTTVLRQYDNGIWYPAERRRIRYYPDGTDKLEHIQKFSKLELDVKVPEETFKLEFPPGTRGWDTTLEDWVIISDTEN